MLLNEELHSLYRSPNIVRVIKSRRLRYAGLITRMEEGRSAFKILTGNYRKEIFSKDLKEMGISTRNWVDSAHDKDFLRALMSAALNHRAL